MKYFRLPETDEEKRRVPPRQRVANGFPVLTEGDVQFVSSDDWTLKIWTCEQSYVLTYQSLLALPQEDFQADFHCVTHWSKLDVEWRGVRVCHLLESLDLKASDKYVLVHCTGGYTTNLLLSDLIKESSFVAHTLNRESLPSERGGPVRLVVPHLYAWKSAKWISGFEILTEEKLGYWEENGYHRRGDPWKQERYSNP